jgi:predicted nucleotidyltransferase
MVTSEQQDEAAAKLDARFGLVALWLFGSEATGRSTAHSDIDFAFLLRRRAPASELHDLQAELAAQWGRDVDLVDLSRASPALAMQVLRHGTLVADRDPSARVQFMTALPSRYEDLRIVRAPIERYIRERLHG